MFSVLAVILGQLPGDWGFFSAYLTGGVVLGVLAVGSTAPGLLQGIIDKFSQLWPDYKERVVGHEAAHLLIGEPGPGCCWGRRGVGLDLCLWLWLSQTHSHKFLGVSVLV